jgi:hypothetical protein
MDWFETREGHAAAISVITYLGSIIRELRRGHVAEARQLLAEEIVNFELKNVPPMLARRAFDATRRARACLDSPHSPKALVAKAEMERLLIFWTEVVTP